MKAITVSDYRAEPELTELPTPEPGPGELLVQLAAAGLNPFDWKVADGALKGVVPYSFPLVMGTDGAGLVVRTGPGVTRFREGDRVYGQFMRLPEGQGSYSEFTLAHQDGKLALIPDELDYPLAAALPTAGVTAYQAVQATEVKDGQTLLINGASGGVGQSAIQFAARLGARVLATGTADVADYLRELGAHTVFDYTEAPTHEQVAAAYPDGIDAIVDLVTLAGGDNGALTALVRGGGTVVSTNRGVDLEALAGRGVRGVNLVNDATPETLTELANLAASGGLRVQIEQTVPLAEAPEAVAKSRSGHSRGKTVILP